MDLETLFEILKAIIIGVVEGITEWLPISSTGHMILVDELFKLTVSDTFLKLFLVVIQIGAVMAIIVSYITKLNPFSRSKTPTEKVKTWRMWGMIVIGCIPAAIIGLALDDWMSEHVYKAYTVAAMLIFYGIVFIILELRNKKKYENCVAQLRKESQIHAVSMRPRSIEAQEHHGFVQQGPFTEEQIDQCMFKITDVNNIDWKTALMIGVFQCLSIVPGTSRSGAIIIGGMLMKCSRKAATEFAFFLAIPIMLGWGFIKAVKYIVLGNLEITTTELGILLAGTLSAFITSVICIRFLIDYIKSHDFKVFGWYRIIIGIIVLLFFALKMYLGF